MSVAENGILNSDSEIKQEDKIDYSYKEDYKLESVVIDKLGVGAIDVQAVKDILSTEADNTLKMKMLTKVIMCKNNSAIDYSDARKVGSSGVFERGEFNVWKARATIEALINRDFSNIPIADVDTKNRNLSEQKRNLLRESKMIDNLGRPYSFFVSNRFGKNRFKNAEIGLRIGTLNAAHDNALYIHNNRSNIREDVFEEYYAIVKNPYFIMFDPEDLTPAKLAKYMYAEGLLTEKQYQYVARLSGFNKAHYNSSASRKLIEILKNNGFDSIAFMSEQFDPGSIGLMVFDESQLIPVTINGLPVENSDGTLADSDESVFFMSENEDENRFDIYKNIKYNKYGKIELPQSDKVKIKQLTGWSDGIINYIRSMDEAKIYIDANLKEVEINGRKCLIRSDIDMDYADATGITNRERIKKGKSPVTSDGKKVHLHHMGQNPNSPLVELTNSEHLGKGNYSILHDTKKASMIDRIKFNYTRQNHWKTRFNIGGNKNEKGYY